jgi:peptide/nickel transport system substrate-binding protein
MVGSRRSVSRRLQVGVVVSIATVLLAACGGGDSDAGKGGGNGAGAGDGQPKSGGTLVIGRASDTAGLDTQTLINGEDMMVKRLLFSPLLDIKQDGSGVEPALAEGFDYDEASLTYTFHLKPATFSDGSPITSEDVKFSLEYSKEGAYYGALFSKMKSVEAPDPETVVVTLDSPDSLFEPGLAFGFVVPKDFGGKSAEDFFKDPVSSGPFTLESWSPGDEMILDKNPKYWDPERPYVDKVDYRIIPDANQKLTAFQSGDIDIFEYLPHQLTKVLTGDVVKKVDPTSRTLIIALNDARPPLDDINVRRAMGLAIDRDTMLKGIWEDNGQVANGLVQPGIADQAPGKSTDWTFDLDAAKKALAASSYDGEPISLLASNEREVEPTVSQTVLDNLTAAGFNIKLETPDYGAAIDQLVAQDFDAFMLGNGSYLPTAGESLLFYATVFAPLASWPNLDESTQLFDQFRSADSDTARQDAVAAFEDSNFENQSMIPIASPDLLFAVQDRVGGWGSTPAGLTMPDKMWIK